MNTKYNVILVLMFLFGIVGSSFAQNLPYMHFKIQKNDTLEFKLKSCCSLYPEDIVSPNNGQYDPFEYIGNDEYNVKYIPDSNFVGSEHSVIEYHSVGGSAWYNSPIKRTIIDIEVVNSILDAKKDIYNISVNSEGDTLDVLVNDSTTEPNIFLDKILNVNHGNAIITSDNKIIFVPETDFEGSTYFNYQISDDAGSTSIGHVILRVSDDSNIPDTIFQYVTNTNTVSLLLPQNGFEQDENMLPLLGDLDLSNDPEFVYTPHVESLGLDQFKLTKNTDTIVVNITIVEGRDDGNVLIDDEIYTAENTSISFNVKDNDYKKNYFNISNTQTQFGTITNEGQGNFTYTPNADFFGVDEFTYTAQLSFFLYQTATVTIFVDNYVPENSTPYNINTSKNSEVVLNYKIPIEGYSFNMISPPLEGTVSIYNGLDTVYVNCGDISGNNLIVYTPSNNYVGSDRFEIEYCPPNDDCELIKIDINVLEEISDSTCPCAAYNCVWPGDADNNGKVDAKDILPIALYMGETGSERTLTTTNWLGLSVDDWDNSQISNGINLKHSDTDGNGYLNEADTLSILDYYNKNHNLYTNLITKQPDYPIYLKSLQQDSLFVGDTLNLFIEVGDEEYPARDLNGISYKLQLDPNVVDSASVHHEFYSDSWLGNASSSLQISKQITDGQIEAAFSRIGFDGVTGIGEIAFCDLIVEDDMEGIKRSNLSQVIPFKIKMVDIVGMNGAGKTIKFPNIEKTFYLRLDGSLTDRKTAISIYPNPAGNNTNIFISGNDRINQYRVFNSVGMLKAYSKVDNSQKVNIDLRSYENGIYFLQIFTTGNERIIKKIEVIK